MMREVGMSVIKARESLLPMAAVEIPLPEANSADMADRRELISCTEKDELPQISGYTKISRNSEGIREMYRNLESIHFGAYLMNYQMSHFMNEDDIQVSIDPSPSKIRSLQSIMNPDVATIILFIHEPNLNSGLNFPYNPIEVH